MSIRPEHAPRHRAAWGDEAIRARREIAFGNDLMNDTNEIPDAI